MALESNAHQRKAGGDWDVHTLGSLRAAVTAAVKAVAATAVPETAP